MRRAMGVSGVEAWYVYVVFCGRDERCTCTVIGTCGFVAAVDDMPGGMRSSVVDVDVVAVVTAVAVIAVDDVVVVMGIRRMDAG